MVQLRRPRWSTVATAVLAPAILVVFGGSFSGLAVAPMHGGALVAAPVHLLAVPFAATHVWGPPALTYSLVTPVGAVAHPVVAGSPGTAGTPGATFAAPPGASDAGAFTPMTHCSKMPRIMDLQSH